ncbi:putative 2-dehydropantoate 2-reductase [bacterium]|nr:putative 2-dehydropantoate 2-reductase [bacterium]
MNPRPRSYAVLGTGAIGGFYGARLQRAGCDVHFLVHRDFAHVRDHGLVVESKDGDFALPRVRAYGDPHDLPQCDVVVVAWKTTQNHLLESILPDVVRPGATVLVLQNGLGTEDQVAHLVPTARVIGGLCFICAHKAGPGHVRHLDYGFVTLAGHGPGGQPQGVTTPMQGVGEDLAAAGIEVHQGDDLRTARWEKLVWNIPYNGLSVLLDATTAELMAQPDTRALVEELMAEVVTGGQACGAAFTAEVISRMLAKTEQMVPYRTSMKLDYDERRPLEIEAIYGSPWRAARAAGRELPRLGALYRSLRFLDARNQRGGATRPGPEP